MRETADLLRDSAERLFSEHCDKAVVLAAEHGEWPAPLWRALKDAGFALALVSERSGGAGLGMAEALPLLRSVGRYAAPVPLAETMIGTWLLAQAGLAAQGEPITIAPVRNDDRLAIERHGRSWHLKGRSHRVPWSGNANAIAVLATMDDTPLIARVSQESLKRVAGKNLAGEPRDDLEFDVIVADQDVGEAPLGFGFEQLQAFGAAMRTMQIAGAMERILELTVRYAQERVQFGRPICKFQAVQQNLAVLAGQAAAAGAAADMAAEGVEKAFSLFAIGAAKGRAGEAASIGAAIAHQVHGAIGFTQEHVLNHSTRRLWSWRDEFGSEAEWNRVVGEQVATVGADRLWATITAAP